MIYFVRCGRDGPIKIGHTTNDLASRMSFLQVGCPWQLQALGTMDGDLRDEAELLKAFGHLNLRGEWFHPAPQLMLFIEAKCGPVKVPDTTTEAFAIVEPTGDEHWPSIVRSILAQRGWSQTRLAQNLGIKQPVVCRWLSGRNSPTGATKAMLRSMLAAAA